MDLPVSWLSRWHIVWFVVRRAIRGGNAPPLMRTIPCFSVAISKNSVENNAPLRSDLFLSHRVMITRPVEVDAVAGGFIKYRSLPRQSIFTYWRELHVAIIRSVGRDFKDYLLATRGRHGPKQRRRQNQVG